MSKNFERNRVLSALGIYDAESLPLEDKVSLFNFLSELAFELVPFRHPVLNVQLINVQDVIDNDYNPNKVAPPEFRLLHHSIQKDGLTMPIVVGHRVDNKNLVIIDGYHRSQIIKKKSDVYDSLSGYMPVVVLNKTLDERISSSVRHNMARGAHQVELTSQLVMKLRELDWSNEDIGCELGMDNDEVLRMQQVTGLAAAFKNNAFSTAWE
ncbi:IbrB-like domain-containing protein [Vibrio sp. BS-M-Sm-2]|uniref:IbrB-like domain-containing protein n=1 Tax=Vibrio sp. BS-M-Sm-2 TaxID=3241167 RepID=UPI00355831B7